MRVIVKVLAWQPSGADAPMLTTSAIDNVALVELAATSSVKPDAVASTVTFVDGQAVVSLDVTVPDDIAVKRTG